MMLLEYLRNQLLTDVDVADRKRIEPSEKHKLSFAIVLCSM